MNEDLSTLGKRLKYLLKKENKTQKWLSELLEVHINTVGFWVRGEFEPDLSTLRFIASYFDVDHTWLITGETAAEYAFRKEANRLILNDESASYGKARKALLESIAGKLAKLDDDELKIIDGLLNKMGGKK